MLRRDNCPLCQAERRTTWYRDEPLFWIADCELCAVPMVVMRRHGMPTPDEEAVMLATLAEVATEVWGLTSRGDPNWWFDKVRRNIPDHWHAHARPGWGFFG